VFNLIATDVFEKDRCMQALYQRFVNEHRLRMPGKNSLEVERPCLLKNREKTFSRLRSGSTGITYPTMK
jgi:hypothetical protein